MSHHHLHQPFMIFTGSHLFVVSLNHVNMYDDVACLLASTGLRINFLPTHHQSSFSCNSQWHPPGAYWLTNHMSFNSLCFLSPQLRMWTQRWHPGAHWHLQSTKTTYKSQRWMYLEFCATINVPPVPASPQIIYQYAAYLGWVHSHVTGDRHPNFCYYKSDIRPTF